MLHLVQRGLGNGCKRTGIFQFVSNSHMSCSAMAYVIIPCIICGSWGTLLRGCFVASHQVSRRWLRENRRLFFRILFSLDVIYRFRRIADHSDEYSILLMKPRMGEI